MKSTFQAKLARHMLAKSEGFTLIELLVVIVIVGVLSAVAVPTFLNQVERSRFAEAQALLAGVRTGAEVYNFDFGKYPADPIAKLFTAILRPDGTTAQYVDGDPAKIAPNYTLGGSITGATATGDAGGAYDGRLCKIKYGSGGTTCTQ